MSELIEQKIINYMSEIAILYASKSMTMFEYRKYFLDKLVEITESKHAFMGMTIFENNEPNRIQLECLSSSVENDGTDEFKKQFGFDEKSIKQYVFTDMQNAIYSVCYCTKKPYYTNNIDNDKNSNGNKCLFAPFGKNLLTFLSYPMIFENKIIGNIGLSGKNQYDDEIIKLLDPIIRLYTTIEYSESINQQLIKEENKRILMETLSDEKEKFISTMSHELRTPMNGIIGSLQILKKTEINKNQSSLIDVSLQSADNLLKKLDDILLYNRNEKNEIDNTFSEFNLYDLIEDIIDICYPNVYSKNINLFYFIKKNDLIILKNDVLKIKQTLINLIDNAIKFSNDNSEIIIEVNIIQQNPIILKFSVEDNGCGIDDEDIEGLFKPFSQIDDGKDRMYSGTGLGLSICKKNINDLGGKIYVNSRLGKGSIFSFEIEFDNTVINPTIMDYNSEATELLKNKSILLICNNAIQNIIYKDLLSVYCDTINYIKTIRDINNILKSSIYRDNIYDIIIIDNDIIKTINNLKIFKKTSVMLIKNNINNNVDNYSFNHVIMNKPIKRNILLNEMCKLITKYENINHSEIESDYESSNGYSDKSDKNDSEFSTHSKDEFGRINKPDTVLIVEDDFVNRTVLKQILTLNKIKSDEAENGIVALDLVKKYNYRIVLMDIRMPIMNGFEATTLMRNDNIQTPVIAITADDTKECKEKCKNIGMGYLKKPIYMDSILNLINHYTPISDTTDFNSIESNQSNIREDLIISDNLIESNELQNIEEVIEHYDEINEFIIPLDQLYDSNVLGQLFDQSEQNFILSEWYKIAIKEMEKIEYPINFNNYDNIRTIGHTIKGSAYNAGLMHVGNMGKKLEYLFNENSINNITPDDIEIHIHKINEAIKLTKEKIIDSIISNESE